MSGREYPWPWRRPLPRRVQWWKVKAPSRKRPHDDHDVDRHENEGATVDGRPEDA